MDKPGQPDKISEPFLLLLAAVVVFTLLSLTNTSFSAGGFTSKPVNTIYEITASGRIEKVPVIRPLLDSAFLSARGIKLESQKDKTAIAEYGSDTLGGLIRFYLALDQLKAGKKKTVRVAYFGDSMVEGDLVTQDLRKSLQDTFGGEGVGFMPVTSIVAGFRQTIIHSYSTNWTDHFLTKPPGCSNCGPGITGHTFQPVSGGTVTEDDTAAQAVGGSWVSYTAVNRPRLDRFCKVRLFYGKGEDAVVNCNGRNYRMEGNEPVNTLTLANQPVKKVKASFAAGNAQYVYGFSMDSDSGVFVDNFAMRGNSGLPLSSWPVNVLRGLDAQLNYDLIILHFGVNVVNSKQKSYQWYAEGMTTVINNFRKAFPNASFLIIGAADKGWRGPEGYTTDPAIPILLNAQRQMAQNTGCAFWSLFDAMGGTGSMVEWVKGDTVYANKDYTHFNHRGAKRVAGLLFNELMREYNVYHQSAQKI
jgi:hypothetical protein